jgi:P-type Ca2+ transporter type 2C
MSHFFTKTIHECYEILNSSAMGLTTNDAQNRKEHYGINKLESSSQETLFSLMLSQFKSPIIYILLVAFVVSLIIKEFTDAWFILAVLIVNAIIGFYQEYTAGQKADALKKSIKAFAFTLRDGVKQNLDSEEITIGDIIFLESGDKVPADLRLIQSNDLYVNESLLTGESVDVNKDANFICDDSELTLADRKNMLYAGSYVSKGRAMAMITAIANDTEVGTIATLLDTSTVTKAPLILRMEDFSLKIAKTIGLIIIFLIFLGLYQDSTLKEVFFLAVALAVSAIPEGLPVAITVALTMASHTMSRKNVIVRKLTSIEGLGSCTFIASDKTGTLTQNRLKVEHFVTPHKDYLTLDDINTHMAQTAFFCNEVSINQEKDSFLGDQVDIALAKYALEHDATLYEKKENAILLDEIPYESENRYSAISYKIDGVIRQYIKGSADEILMMSTLNDIAKEDIMMQIDEWAAKGYRLIALATKTCNESELSLSNFDYIGFVAIMDPLREGVIESVTKAKHAGINIAMITGDHPNTAYHIAHQLGIALDKDEIMDGKEISLWIEEGALAKHIAHKRVFARVTPEQKQIIVNAFQELGHYVAVTGDGVNDAPALKHANIGISMGLSGTDVAREASDLILTDDAFTSIINGITVGRVVYDNIRKVIHLLISTGFAEVVLILLSMLFFLPVALLPVQLLWLNLVTNGIQHIALSLDNPEEGVLKRQPRPPQEPIFNTKMVRRIIFGAFYMGISSFALFYTLLQFGYSVDSARNLVLLLMVLFENVHVFNSRSERLSIFKINHLKNRFLLISVMAAQLIHIGSMQIPFMQNLLHLEPVSPLLWSVLLGIALVLVIVMELEKFLFERKVQRA